jgi:hypothetical protein
MTHFRSINPHWWEKYRRNPVVYPPPYPHPLPMPPFPRPYYTQTEITRKIEATNSRLNILEKRIDNLSKALIDRSIITSGQLSESGKKRSVGKSAGTA